MIESKKTYAGQRERYGDFFREWDIVTDESMETVLEYCFAKLIKRRIPSKKEWAEKIKYGHEKAGDADYYFSGFYNLGQTEYGYTFVVCEPYCD